MNNSVINNVNMANQPVPTQPVIPPASVPAVPAVAPAPAPAPAPSVVAQPQQMTPITPVPTPAQSQPAQPMNPIDSFNATIDSFQKAVAPASPEPASNPGFFHGAAQFIGGVLHPLSESIAAPIQLGEALLDKNSTPESETIHMPEILGGDLVPPSSIEGAVGNALQTVALGLGADSLAEEGLSAGVDASGKLIPSVTAKVLGSAPVQGAIFGGGAAMSNNENFKGVLEGAGIGAATGQVFSWGTQLLGGALKSLGASILQPFTSADLLKNSAAVDGLTDLGVNADDAPIGTLNPKTNVLTKLESDGFGGKSWLQGQVDNVNAFKLQLLNAGGKLIKALGFDGTNIGESDPTSIANGLIDEANKVLDATNDARTRAIQASLKDPEFQNFKVTGSDLTETKAALDNIIEQKKSSLLKPDAGKFEDLRENMSKAQPKTLADLWQTHLDVSAKAYPKFGSQDYASPEVAQWRIVSHALDSDISDLVNKTDNEPLKNAFDAMKTYTQETHAILDDPINKAIQKAMETGNADGLYAKLTNPNNINALKFWMEKDPATGLSRLQPETIANIKVGYLDSLFNDATKNGTIDWGKFATKIDNVPDAVLRTMFGDDGMVKLQAIKAQAMLNGIVEDSMQGGEISFKKLATNISKMEGAHPGTLEANLPERTYQQLKDLSTIGEANESNSAFLEKLQEKDSGFSNILKLTGSILHSTVTTPINIIKDLVGGPALRAFMGTDFGQTLATTGFGEMKPLVDSGQFVQKVSKGLTGRLASNAISKEIIDKQENQNK